MSNFHCNRTASVPSTHYFPLHTHDTYELYLFISGDCDYVIEGAIYPLKPYDLIFIAPGEMHTVSHKSDAKYDRIVVYMSESFFKENDCAEYLNIFTEREKGTRNKLSSSVVCSCGIDSCFEKLERYSDNFQNHSSAIMKGILIEILHLMNNTQAYSAPTTNRIQQVISFINTNFTKNITLSNIAKNFYVSKSHLAREFHTATGHTLGAYITKKRLSHAIKMANEGKSLLEAALTSGFGDYAAFYRAFREEYNQSPKKYLKENL